MNISELLYGKPLQTLTTQALISLANTPNITVKQVLFKIAEIKPEINPFIETVKDQQRVMPRLINCIKRMAQTGLITIEREYSEELNIKRIIITKNLNNV